MKTITINVHDHSEISTRTVSCLFSEAELRALANPGDALCNLIGDLARSLDKSDFDAPPIWLQFPHPQPQVTRIPV